jgi:hypothetical protein
MTFILSYIFINVSLLLRNYYEYIIARAGGEIKAIAHNSGAQTAQPEFSSDRPKIAGKTLRITEDFWMI